MPPPIARNGAHDVPGTGLQQACYTDPDYRNNRSTDPMSDDGKPRLDKWLWAARFFKTRALAKAAIEGGKVHYAGERSKPSKEPKIGDEVQVRQGFDQRTVVIRAISVVRRGAPEAQLLYE